MLVIMNVLFGLPAVMTWAAFGTVLRRAFATPRSATLLNRGMGASLFAVALWIVIPPDYYSSLWVELLVQRAGFEPAKHYALGPHPSPFDRSGTSACVSVGLRLHISEVS